MTTIASLGIKVESGDAVEAATDLDKLAQAGEKAEKAADGLASSFDKAASSAGTLAAAEGRVSESTEDAMTRLTAMAKASLDSSEYHKSLAASLTGTSSAMGAASAAATDWSAYQAEVNARARTLMETEERLAGSVRQAAAATGVQGEGLQALLGKINPALAALDKLDQQQADLQKYRNVGLVDPDTFREYNTRIEASRQKLGEFDEGLRQTGVSTGQTQAALRQLPAQFTDIFTSLAGGQNPLMVLIQQGGQIKDSFGGVEETFDALKSKFLSLFSGGSGAADLGGSLYDIASSSKDVADSAGEAGESLSGLAEQTNTAAEAAGNAKTAIDAVGPSVSAASVSFWSIAAAVAAGAAAIGTLIYGYSQGSKEADEFNKSLILTGNYAGTSAAALGDMARRVSDINGTTGEAAETLTKMADSGKIATGSFEQVANAAIAMEDATGKSVDATIAEFVKIADDPVKAAKALNDQYHFLTAAVYSQVVALKDQGNEIGATKLLTDTYADTVMRRSDDVTENLGLWERGWKRIKAAASEAVDGISDFGRAKSFDEQIAALEAKLTGSEAYDVGGTRMNAREVSPVERQKIEAQIQSLRLQKQEQLSREAARKADQQRQESAISGMQLISREAETARSEVGKLEKRLSELQKARAKNIANNSFTGETEKQYIQAEADLQKRIDEAKKRGSGGTSEVDLTGYNDQKNALNAILAEYKNHQKELDAAQKAGIISQESYAAQRAAIIEQQRAEVTSAYEAEINALEEAKGRSATNAQQRIQLDQKISDARANMVKAQKDADSELAVLATNEEGRLVKQARAVQTYTDALDQQVKALQLQGQRAADGLGLGDRQRSLQDQQNGITDRTNQQRLDLANQYGDGSRGMSLDEYNQKLAALVETEQDLQKTTIANYDQMSAAQGDWRSGASSAFQNYLEQARDVAGQTRSLFTNAFSSMEDAVVNFAMTGKFSFADFTKSILADMARIATQKAIAGIAGSILGSVAGAYFTPGGQTVSTSGFSEGGFVPNAKGGVYDSPSLSSFSNQIHDTPQFFAFAKGAGVFAEAGPEAIMPLTRTSDGNLGVRAIGGGGGGTGGASISINAPVSINVADRSDEGMELDQTLLQQNMQAQMKAAAERAVADSWRAGGVSYRNSQRRA